MKKLFFVRAHACPDCGGSIKWFAKECRFCHYCVSFFDRCDWADNWAKLLVFSVGGAFGAGLGLILIKTPPALLMAATIATWYVCLRQRQTGQLTTS